MADMIYDHPEYQITKFHSFTNAAGASSVNRWCVPTNVLLKKLNIAVVTAGTSATTGNGMTVRVISGNGTTTTSVGALAVGTSSANVSTNTSFGTVTSAVQNGTQVYLGQPVAAGDIVTITSGTDATGVMAVTLSYRTLPGADVPT